MEYEDLILIDFFSRKMFIKELSAYVLDNHC